MIIFCSKDYILINISDFKTLSLYHWKGKTIMPQRDALEHWSLLSLWYDTCVFYQDKDAHNVEAVRNKESSKNHSLPFSKKY